MTVTPSSIWMAQLPEAADGASHSHPQANPQAHPQPQPQDTDQGPRFVLRRVHVQVVHRHGDRSPITALRDEVYWQTQILSIPKERVVASTSTAVGVQVKVVADDVVRSHKANGRGVFGKLTTLGWQQMVELGRRLRNELFPPPHDHRPSEDADNHLVVTTAATTATSTTTTTSPPPLSANAGQQPKVDHQGNWVYPYLRHGKPAPEHVQVVSTSFERAIQSAHGVLAGLFTNSSVNERIVGTDALSSTPSSATNATSSTPILIDARHTIRLLPDPQPRTTAEQIELEDILAARPHLQKVEDDLLPLVLRVTEALRPLLADDAHEAVFGAKQVRRQRASDESIEQDPLAWNQLAEITKCLACRGLLPKTISESDHHAVVQHAAWRWFESFRHPRLAYLSMHAQVEHMLKVCQQATDWHDLPSHAQLSSPAPPPLVLYSAHDSTLIGLLCALKLEQPVAWPEYGSFLMMELFQVTRVVPTASSSGGSNPESEWYIRFSLNGQLLRSEWQEGKRQSLQEMIRLDRLWDKVQKEDEATRGMTETAAHYRYAPI